MSHVPLQHLHKLLVVVVAVGMAEGFSSGSDLVVEGDHLGAAEAQKVLEAGRGGPGQERHAQKPPAQAKPDDESGQAALHTGISQVGNNLLQLWAKLIPTVLALIARPSLKHATVGREHDAVVDGQMKAFPLHALEFLGRQLLAQHGLGFRMEGAVEDFEVYLLQEGKNVRGTAFGETAEPAEESGRK